MVETSLSKDKIRFLLLEGVHQSAVDHLSGCGYSNIEYIKTALTKDQLIDQITDAHFVGIRSRTQLTDEVLSHAKKLIGIGCFCIGTNQVDLKAASKLGVPVFNAPYSNTRSVAELVLAEAILLMRGIPEKNAKAHQGQWLKSASHAFEARGKTLGIIGYGSIGSQLSVLAESLGMKVIFYDVITKLPLGNAEQISALPNLLAQSDVVTLHVPETPATKTMFGKTQLDQMKAGGILINAARGTVVDIDALAGALESKHIKGAAIDVFPAEPKSNDEEFISPLRAFDNVILTPHIGGSTMEAQENIGLEVSEKLIRYSDNGSTLSSVNFPEVALPQHDSTHRLMHIHQNVPGILTQINKVFSENEINICGQYLQTQEDIGYVVIDLEAKHSDFALKELQNVKGTIKARRLF